MCGGEGEKVNKERIDYSKKVGVSKIILCLQYLLSFLREKGALENQKNHKP